MNYASTSNTKLTDQLERSLTKQAPARSEMGVLRDIQRAIEAVQSVIVTLRSQARSAKVAFANG